MDGFHGFKKEEKTFYFAKPERDLCFSTKYTLESSSLQSKSEEEE